VFARAIIAVALAALAGCATSPVVGSFYQVDPGPLKATAGDLLRSEPLSGAPAGAAAYRILYASTGLDGNPIPVSGVVIVPAVVSSGPRKIIAWAHPTSGIAVSCAPSLSGGVFKTIPGLTEMLARGYVVTAADYPGLGTIGPHPYLVGLSEGRAVLDSVRAARRLAAANAGPRFAVWGHSQGGQAVLFAGEIARSYAPELSLVGVAAIAPATDLPTLLRDNIQSELGGVLGSYCLSSWSKFYGAPLDPLLSPTSRRAVEAVSATCVGGMGDAIRMKLELRHLKANFVLRDPAAMEPWRSLLSRNTPGREPAGAPLFIAQGTIDPIIRPAVTARFVAEQRQRGECVRYVRLDEIGHLIAGHVCANPAISWIDDRFAGQAAPNDDVFDQNFRRVHSRPREVQWF
jgi:alpha-beta hydrolase superfamily lysophospholipase